MADDRRIRLKLDANQERFVAREYIADNRAFDVWLGDHWPAISQNILRADFDDSGPPAIEGYSFWAVDRDGAETELERKLPLERQIGTESEVRIRIRRRLLRGRIELRYVSDDGADGTVVDVEMADQLGVQLRDHLKTILDAHTFRRFRRKRCKLVTEDGSRVNLNRTPEQLGFGAHEVLHLRTFQIGGWPPVAWEIVVAAVLSLAVIAGAWWLLMPRQTVDVHLAWQGSGPARISVRLPDRLLPLELEPEGTTETVFSVRADRIPGGLLIAKVSPQSAPLFRDTVRIDYGSRRKGSCTWEIADPEGERRNSISMSVEISFSGSDQRTRKQNYKLMLNGYEWPLNSHEDPYHGVRRLPRGVYRIECLDKETGEILKPSFVDTEGNLAWFPADVFRISDGLFDFRCPDRNAIKINLYYEPPEAGRNAEREM